MQGSPNATISSIDTSGGIVSSRDGESTLDTPFFIQVSASAITATGTSKPYEDLEYSWDFGDPSGVETTVRPTDGVTVNLNSSQIGPEAAYVYMQPGTYTITLGCRGKNGGAYTTAMVTKTVVVTAFAVTTTLWASSLRGGGTGAGTSLANAFQNTTDLRAAMAAVSGACLVNIEAGSHFSSAVGINFNHSNLAQDGFRVVKYGSGANPIIEMTSGGEAALNIGNGSGGTGHTRQNIVIQEIDFLNSGSNSGVISCGAGETSAFLKNLYAYRCIATQTYDRCYTLAASFTGSVTGGTSVLTTSGTSGFINGDLTFASAATNANVPQGVSIQSQLTGTSGGNGTYQLSQTIVSTITSQAMEANGVGKPVVAWGNFSTLGIDQATRCGMWMCSSIGPTTTNKTVGIGYVGSSESWYFNMACYSEGGGTSATLDHHHYPDTKLHGLWSHPSFGPTGPKGTRYERSYCFNLNWDGIYADNTDHQVARYNVITDAMMQNAIWSWDMGNRSNNTSSGDSTAQFADTVIQRSGLKNIAGGLYACALSVTIRDMRQWADGTVAIGYFNSPSGYTQVSGYEQPSHMTGQTYRIKIYVTTGVSDSLILLQDANWTAKQVYTDMEIVDERAAPGVFNIRAADWLTGASVVDRNTYYFTQGSTLNAFANAGSTINYATWKALAFAPDVNSSNLTSNTLGWTLPVTQWSHMG